MTLYEIFKKSEYGKMDYDRYVDIHEENDKNSISNIDAVMTTLARVGEENERF